jgi:hypothetical protein
LESDESRSKDIEIDNKERVRRVEGMMRRNAENDQRV